MFCNTEFRRKQTFNLSHYSIYVILSLNLLTKSKTPPDSAEQSEQRYIKTKKYHAMKTIKIRFTYSADSAVFFFFFFFFFLTNTTQRKITQKKLGLSIPRLPKKQAPQQSQLNRVCEWVWSVSVGQKVAARLFVPAHQNQAGFYE